MTTKIKDLKNFVKGLDQDKISRKQLEKKIFRYFGLSEYFVKSRLRMLLNAELIKVSKESNDIFDVMRNK